jgi:hypothetical protein
MWRVYSPSTDSFFDRPGTLECANASAAISEATATGYQLALGSSIEALRDVFTACYNAELGRNPKAEGTSCVKLIIDSEGKVDQTLAPRTLPALQDERRLCSNQTRTGTAIRVRLAWRSQYRGSARLFR